MKSLFSIGLVLMPLIGSACAADLATAEATLRIGTPVKAPVEFIEDRLSIIKTDRQLLDEIATRLALKSSWKLGDDEIAKKLAERIFISVERPGQTSLQAHDEDPVKAVILANAAASVLRDHLEVAKMEHLELQASEVQFRKAAENKRSHLSQIIRTAGITYNGESSPKSDRPENDETHAPDSSPAAFLDAKKDYEEAQAELEAILIKILTYRNVTVEDIRWATAPAE